MNSKFKLNESIVSGILLLSVGITIIVSGMLASMAVSLTFSPDQMANVMEMINARKDLHIASIAFDLASFILTVLLAGSLYQVFHKEQPSLSLCGAFCLLASGIILSYHDIANFTLPNLASDYLSLHGESAQVFLLFAKNILLAEIWGVKIGYTYFSIGILLFGINILFHSQFGKWLGYLGIFSAAATIVISFFPLPENNKDIISMLAFLPMLIWEFAFGINLIMAANKS
jgi:hypothetical protein